MLGVGWTEMLVIGVVALIFIGPKDLPIVMRRVGQFAGMIRRMGSDFQRELNKTTGLDEVRSLRNSITAPLRQTTEEIRREFNAIGKDGKAQPSGAIKPADPKAESVVDEIKAKAGMMPASPPEPAAPASPVEPVAKKEPVKAKRPARAKPVAESTVSTSSLEDVSLKAQPTKVAPAEPVKKAAARKPRVTTKTSATGPAKAAPKPRTRKPKSETLPEGDAGKA